MSNHDENQDSNLSFSERFVPLSDNNNNLSFGKVITLMVSLALIVYGLMTIVKNTGGYLTNEEQVEWRKEHNKPMKDSNENKHSISDENSEGKEEMKGEDKVEVKEDAKEGENKMEEKKMEEKKMEKKEEHKHK